jgi:hypothetical protein
VHTDLSVTKLEPGGWTGLHLHSFESAASPDLVGDASCLLLLVRSHIDPENPGAALAYASSSFQAAAPV